MVVFYSVYRKNLKLYDFCAISKKTFSYITSPVAASVYDHTSDFIANIKNLPICCDKFWKTPLKITVKNLRTFQGTYL